MVRAGIAKGVALADGILLLDLLSPGNAHVFERAMANNDRLENTDLRGCQCLICHEPITDGQEAELACPMHPFHAACQQRWRAAAAEASRDATCPTCRFVLPPPKPRSAAGVPPDELKASRPQRLLSQCTERESLVTPAARAMAANVALLRTLMQAQPADTAAPPYSSKVATLLSILRGDHADVRIAPTDKVIVYTLINDALPMIKYHLRKDGISCIALNKDPGALSIFRDDASGIRVLLIKASLSGTGTGAAGLDLPVANTVILLDEMPCDLRAQCMDRVHRIGQECETTVVQISARDSVDAPLHALYCNLNTSACGATLGVPALKAVFVETCTLTAARLRELAGEGGMQLEEVVEAAEAEEAAEAAEGAHEAGDEPPPPHPIAPPQAIAEEEAAAAEAVAADGAAVEAEEQEVEVQARVQAEVQATDVEAEAEAEVGAEEVAEAEAEAEGEEGEEEEEEEEDDDDKEPPPAKRRRPDPTQADVVQVARRLGLSEEICDALQDNLVNGQLLYEAPDTDLTQEVGLSRLQLRRLRMELERV